jgi:Antirestriction protein
MSDPTITSRKLTVEERMKALPAHFGHRMLVIEYTIFDVLGDLAEAYSGAFWHFYELSNGGFYMAPELEPLKLSVAGNGFEGELSADAAGIVACLFAYCHLSFVYSDEGLVEHYHRLRDFALEHTEREKILAAID